MNERDRERIEDIPSEQFMKFSIGLRLLGKQKRERYLAYLLSLQEKNSKNKESPKQ